MNIIIGVLFLISAAYCAECLFDSDIEPFHKIMSSIILIAVIILALTTFNTPTAMDVYKGKTELKYNGVYKDSVFIPTDSTVN